MPRASIHRSLFVGGFFFFRLSIHAPTQGWLFIHQPYPSSSLCHLMYRYQFQVDNKKVFSSQPRATVSLENNPLGREGIPYERVRNIFDIED